MAHLELVPGKQYACARAVPATCDCANLFSCDFVTNSAKSASPWATENPPVAPSSLSLFFLVLTMSVTVVLGAQWGDEGKGKLADILAHESQICCRAQGGNNAGHTIVANGVTYDFHILPSGLVNPGCINVIGSGCVVHVPSFFKELEALEKHGLKTDGRIFISDRAHVVFDVHQMVDGLEEVELAGGFIGKGYTVSQNVHLY